LELEQLLRILMENSHVDGDLSSMLVMDNEEQVRVANSGHGQDRLGVQRAYDGGSGFVSVLGGSGL
jgi:hypothetical protein